MTLEEVRRMATQIVHEQARGVEVLGVTSARGGSDYTEIFLEIRDCSDPTRARAKQTRLRLMKEPTELYLASRREERGNEDYFDDEFTKELENRVSSV
jgi:hypothetical protein